MNTNRKRYPRVTLLIPCYKSAPFFQEAINSALNQTYGHVEIIVAPDDGDKYKELRKIYTSPQLRVIPPGPKERTGAGATRNRALDASTGEFITMLDSDDKIPPDYVEKLMEVAIKEGVAVSNSQYVSWDEAEIVRRPPIHRSRLSLSGFSQLLASLHPLVHRSYEPGYVDGFAEDVVRDGIVIASFGTIPIVQNVSYIARLRPNSICNSGAETEKAIQSEYRRRIEQITKRPSELSMHRLPLEERIAFANLFRFRAAVSKQFADSGAVEYNRWVAGKEAALWDDFMSERAVTDFSI